MSSRDTPGDSPPNGVRFGPRYQLARVLFISSMAVS